MGNAFLNRAVKLAYRSVSNDLSEVGVKCGYEAATHVVRYVIQHAPVSSSSLLLKVDLKHTFNRDRCNYLLETCLRDTPSFYSLTHITYGTLIPLMAANYRITFSIGVLQGNLLGLFLLTIDDVIQLVHSFFSQFCVVWMSLLLRIFSRLFNP